MNGVEHAAQEHHVPICKGFILYKHNIGNDCKPFLYNIRNISKNNVM